MPLHERREANGLLFRHDMSRNSVTNILDNVVAFIKLTNEVQVRSR